MATLYRDLGTVDTPLNQIDARLKHATPKQSAALVSFRRQLTYNPRNIEDLSGPAGLREHVFDLIGRTGSSFQAPTAAQREQGAKYQAEVERVSTEYRTL